MHYFYYYCDYDSQQGGIMVKIITQKKHFINQLTLICPSKGLSIGFIAGSIDLSEGFLFDLKFGFCLHGVFQTQSLCCENTFEANCEDWLTYAELVSLGDDFYLAYAVNYVVYIAVGIIFALTSAWLVKVLAPWAAGGGIPEVKTILGGFVFTGFMSIQTLLIKISGCVSCFFNTGFNNIHHHPSSSSLSSPCTSSPDTLLPSLSPCTSSS
jgi:hypothetical protein